VGSCVLLLDGHPANRGIVVSAYPDRALTIAVLLEVARKTGIDASSPHPEDIAVHMAVALEAAAHAIQAMHDRSQ
jgi:hypothetical protein